MIWRAPWQQQDVLPLAWSIPPFVCRPPTCRGVVNFQSFLEIVHVIENIFHEQRLFLSFAPAGRLKSPQHKIFIADDFRLAFLKGQSQHLLKLILVDDQKIAFRAIAAMLVNCRRIIGLDVDKEGYFADRHFPFTARARGKTRLCMRIQNEPVHWRQLANLWKGRLLGHTIQAYTVHKVYHQSKSRNERIPVLRMAGP
jgi:hypothetical protein